MLSGLQSAVRWLMSLSRRLIGVVPGYTLFSVAATLFSQLALLLAFVLPLKVILLLGADGIPRYFPDQFKVFDRQSLILALSGLAMLLFLVHLLAERLIGQCIVAGSGKLLSRSRKMVLFENQDEMAAKAYQRFSRGLASLVFLLFFIPLLFWLNSYLAWVFIAYLLVSVAGSLLLAALLPTFQARLTNAGGQIAALLAGVGFLLCFGYMVAEFLWLQAPSVLVAVVCLLLLRQLFRHSVSFVNDALALVERRRQLSALFFHGQRLIEAPRHGFDGVWSLIESATRDEWLRRALGDVTSRSLVIKAVRWLQLGVADVVAYRVVACEDGKEDCFLVKVYENNRSAMAKHEATLLVGQANLPTLGLLGVTDVGGRFHCHVFALDSARQALGKKWPVRCEVARSALLACAPNEELKALYRRSKACLVQRMERDVLRRMRCLLDSPAQLEELLRFEESFDRIRELIGGLPMVIVNPDIRRGLVMLDDYSRVLVCHWARWSLEPIGSGWPIDERAMKVLAEAHEAAAAQRSDMAGVRVAQLKLAALLFAFERSCKQQDYHGAADLLGRINKAFADSVAD
ncbi:hypothetical protein N878_01550 [Pseudomonas sp. EGD-AK9]|uniref:hypothetical protein n=1 Tax=Pseudomonas sp. EGD-AK9 TaxID=1386078 RepID=UPI000396099B|nr:hypothetical protein [Pseudomonas sp. EGD-AK9]ERI50953.1 hypothetical protein N878_01550 [Pseudomonas sp. EGD-AK9]